MIKSGLEKIFLKFLNAEAIIFELLLLYEGQLNLEWIHEVIYSPKMSTKILKDCCPTL